MAAMKHSTGWKNGPRRFPAAYVAEEDIAQILVANGFQENKTVMETFPADQEDYKEVVFFTSYKNL
jgi:hypothetical protein